MAEFNELQYYPGLGTGSRRMFGLSGDTGEGVSRLSETLYPIADLWAVPEWPHHRGERLLAWSEASPAVVGEFSMFAVLNPVGSGFLTVIDNASVVVGVAIDIAVSLATSATILATLGTEVSLMARDTREIPAGVGAQSVSKIRIGTDAANLGNTVERIPGVAVEAQPFRSPPFVITPGFALVFEAMTQNTAIRINVRGRERRALPGELI